MQIGTRWRAGAPAPESVPTAITSRVLELEQDAQLTGDWTLTWLEGHAVATHSCGLRVLELETGKVAVLAPGESEFDLHDDDWL